MDIRYQDRSVIILSAAALACLMGASKPAFSQDIAKPISEKWRPKDGLYIEPSTEFTGPCEDAAPFLFELSKKRFVVDERSGCRVTRITDTAPGALRLDMICDEVDNPDEGDGKKYKEVMTLRKIDDGSFFMHVTVKGKFQKPEWRVDYCPKTPADKWPSAFEIKRDAVRQQLKTTQWQPRSGVYASPGPDFNDRCIGRGDAVIELEQISISSGASHCEISSIDSSTQASIKLKARCDLKPGDPGQVARSIRGEIVFAPAGSEDIIITNSGNETLTLKKSRNGEFSELGQLLAYCPEAAQRAYADPKKAK